MVPCGEKGMAYLLPSSFKPNSTCRKLPCPPITLPLTSCTRVRPLQITSAGSAKCSDVKIANLSAKRKKRVKLPNYGDGCQISRFLCHPSGIEAILNKKSFQTFKSLDSNTYRCTLPTIKFLTFEVAPVLDLRVIPTSEDCTVELLSCKFEGSEALERQNDRFLAFMRNHIIWDADGSEQCLDLDIELNISLEVYTQPFSSLPISAVEKPGNLHESHPSSCFLTNRMMQSLVDRLAQLLLQQLLQDYDHWVLDQSNICPGVPESM